MELENRKKSPSVYGKPEASIGRVTSFVERRLHSVVQRRLTDEPVVALQGPRAVGKSTLLTSIASACGRSVLDLDDLATRDAASADPAFAVVGDSPVCIDEYQHVPELLDAIKAELNRDLRPGRFLLAGSTNNQSLPARTQALTGRLHVVPVYPFSQREVARVGGSVVDSLFRDPAAVVAAAAESTTERSDYVGRVLAGGMPLAVARTAGARGRWFDDYISRTVERDVRELQRVRQRGSLARLLQQLAAQTAQVLNVAALARECALEPTTAENYTRLLEAVFVITRLPAWGTTLRRRATASPKVHVIDSGVAGRLLRLTPERLARLDPTAMSEFGHLLETFAVMEVIKETTWLDGIAGGGHWRTHDGDEVDLVVERDDGRVIAVEVKAGSRVASSDLSGLRKLRSALGEAFACGVVLHLGAHAFTVEERLHALPLDVLWREVP